MSASPRRCSQLSKSLHDLQTALSAGRGGLAKDKKAVALHLPWEVQRMNVHDWKTALLRGTAKVRNVILCLCPGRICADAHHKNLQSVAHTKVKTTYP